jgi:hypothetical protein
MFWHNSVEINSCPYLFFLKLLLKAVTAEAMILSLMTGRISDKPNLPDTVLVK